MNIQKSMLDGDRFLGEDEGIRKIARKLYVSVATLPIVSFHGHVPPKWLAENTAFEDATEFFIIPDHYLFRFLHSTVGMSYDEIGIRRRDGSRGKDYDPRKVWRTFAENYHRLAGTPMKLWMDQQLRFVFGLTERLNADNADKIYDAVTEKLHSDGFSPRALYHEFNIAVLCTTDNPWDDLRYHQMVRDNPQWGVSMVPGWRPDGIANIIDPAVWRENIGALCRAENVDIKDADSLREALARSRKRFIEMGATLTDHGILYPRANPHKMLASFMLARGPFSDEDRYLFTEHVTGVSAQLSAEDGLVQQIHAGVHRNTNPAIFRAYGPDMGFDIPGQVDFVHNLTPLLVRHQGDEKYRCVAYCTDSLAIERELIPLAGSYGNLFIGDSWWMRDHPSVIGRDLGTTMERDTSYFKRAGFPDDTRALGSIVVRHDTARRGWAYELARKVLNGEMEIDEAKGAIMWKAYYGPLNVFRLQQYRRSA